MAVCGLHSRPKRKSATGIWKKRAVLKTRKTRSESGHDGDHGAKDQNRHHDGFDIVPGAEVDPTRDRVKAIAATHTARTTPNFAIDAIFINDR